MPHTLCAIDVEDETIAELEMIVGFDDDLAGEATRIGNRLRVLLMLERFGSPTQLCKAGHRRLVDPIRAKAPRMAECLVDDVFTALDEQTVVVAGADADADALIVPSLSGQLKPSSTNASSSPRGSRNSWRPTLFPKS